MVASARFVLFPLLLVSLLFAGLTPAHGAALPAGRVLVLGDSITYAGQYVEFLETGLRLWQPTVRFDLLNLGLPSETVSGLSEPGHAGGAFPRPDLHERLERALTRTRPAVVLASYGMNDGIYHPLSEERFASFQRGMRRLHDRVTGAGIRIVHLTPSPFDPLPLEGRTLPAGRTEYPQPYAGYDDVLARYSAWLVERRAEGWEVVDVHTALNRFVAARRQTQPDFRLAGDGVHPDVTGHWLMAREILRYFDVAPGRLTPDDATAAFAASPPGPALLALVQQRQRLEKDAWLADVGHQRPGMAKGRPLAEVEKEAAGIEAQIRALLAPASPQATGDRPAPAR